MNIQKFIPEKHCTELVRVEDFIKKPHPLNEGRILNSSRTLYYWCNDAPDRSFVECQAAIKIGRAWMIWPQGFKQWVELQAQKTLTNYAA